MRARVTALTTAVLALAALVAAMHSPRAEAQAAALRASGQAVVSNSRDGSAVLGGVLGPGDSLSGTVTVGNVGSAAGDMTLALSHLVNVPPGPGTGLSGKLTLAVDDVTGAAPLSVYQGPLESLPATTLGGFAPGTTRTYRFTVSWADGGAADGAYAGSSMSVQFDWSMVSGDDTTTAPPQAPPTGPSSPRLAAPKLSFRAAGRQRVIKLRATVVHARCDQACTVTIRASLGMRHVRKAVKLRATHANLPAGVDRKIKLKLPKAVIKRMRTALRQHRRPVLKLTATAVSANGAASPVNRKVRVIG